MVAHLTGGHRGPPLQHPVWFRLRRIREKEEEGSRFQSGGLLLPFYQGCLFLWLIYRKPPAFRKSGRTAAGSSPSPGPASTWPWEFSMPGRSSPNRLPKNGDGT